MKKIGVISDAHGNLAALNAALEYLDAQHCGEIIHTGDVVDIGPQSRECLETLTARKDVTMLLGNHDRDFVLNEAETRKLSHVPTEHKRQVFDSMNETLRARVAEFPLYVTRRCGNQTLMFTHYAFKDEPFDVNVFPFKPLTQHPTAELFDEMFANAQCDAVFFGHKHEPCDISGSKLYVDVGSVGCHPQPFACGILIEYDDFDWKYTRFAVPYDMEQTRAKLSQMKSGNALYDFYYLRKKPE